MVFTLSSAMTEVKRKSADGRKAAYGLILAALFASGPCPREDEKLKHLWYHHLHVKWDSLLEDIFCVVRGRKEQLRSRARLTPTAEPAPPPWKSMPDAGKNEQGFQSGHSAYGREYFSKQKASDNFNSSQYLKRFFKTMRPESRGWVK